MSTQLVFRQEPWSRRPKESVKAFGCFKIYRDLGDKRTLIEAARISGKSVGSLSRWSAMWGWVERARAWDVHLDDKKRESQISEVQEMAKRHATIACIVQQKVVQKLNSLTDQQVEAMTFEQLVSLFGLAVKTELRARGEPDVTSQSKSHNVHTGSNGGPVQVEVLETVVRTRADVKALLQAPQAEILKAD